MAAGDVEPAAWSKEIKRRIRRRYERQVLECEFIPEGPRRMRESGYPPRVLEQLPRDLAVAYCGCGNPAAVLDLRKVRLAVDLGCGAGIDAWCLARNMRAGAVLALDMTTAMLRMLVRTPGVREAGRVALWPVGGDLESLPLADGIADLVIANAAFNLAVDKSAAFSEAHRVLKPGGRLAACDLIRQGELPGEVMQDPLADVTSLGGAVTEDALRRAMAQAGFTGIRISGHRPFSRLTSIRIDARKPAAGELPWRAAAMEEDDPSL